MKNLLSERMARCESRLPRIMQASRCRRFEMTHRLVRVSTKSCCATVSRLSPGWAVGEAGHGTNVPSEDFSKHLGTAVLNADAV